MPDTEDYRDYSDDGEVLVFHGTTTPVLKEISATGMISGHFTDDFEIAKDMAHQRAVDYGGEPVVIVLRLSQLGSPEVLDMGNRVDYVVSALPISESDFHDLVRGDDLGPRLEVSGSSHSMSDAENTEPFDAKDAEIDLRAEVPVLRAEDYFEPEVIEKIMESNERLWADAVEHQALQAMIYLKELNPKLRELRATRALWMLRRAEKPTPKFDTLKAGQTYVTQRSIYAHPYGFGTQHGFKIPPGVTLTVRDVPEERGWLVKFDLAEDFIIYDRSGHPYHMKSDLGVLGYDLEEAVYDVNIDRVEDEKPQPSGLGTMDVSDVDVIGPRQMQQSVDRLLDQLYAETDPEKKRQIEQRIRSLNASLREWRMQRRAATEPAYGPQRLNYDIKAKNLSLSKMETIPSGSEIVVYRVDLGEQHRWVAWFTMKHGHNYVAYADDLARAGISVPELESEDKSQVTIDSVMDALRVLKRVHATELYGRVLEDLDLSDSSTHRDEFAAAISGLERQGWVRKVKDALDTWELGFDPESMPQTPSEVPTMSPADRERRVNLLLDEWQEAPESERAEIERKLRELRAFFTLWMQRQADEELEPQDEPTIDEEMENEPSDDDIIIADSRRGGYGAYQSGHEIARSDEWDDLLWEIKEYMDQQKFWPNVWQEEERGGFHIVDMSDVQKSELPIKSKPSYVPDAVDFEMTNLPGSPWHTYYSIGRQGDDIIFSSLPANQPQAGAEHVRKDLDEVLMQLEDGTIRDAKSNPARMPIPEDAPETVQDIPVMDSKERQQALDRLLDQYSKADPELRQHLERKIRELQAVRRDHMGWLKKADGGSPEHPCKECGKDMGMAYFLDDLGICTDCVRKKHRDVTEPGWRKKKAEMGPKSLDDVSREITGEDYKDLPDDGPEQDYVMSEYEKQAKESTASDEPENEISEYDRQKRSTAEDQPKWQGVWCEECQIKHDKNLHEMEDQRRAWERIHDREKTLEKGAWLKNAENGDLSQFECVEGDGRPAVHLHGGHMGLEPCCGQHPDCSEED